MQKHGQSRPGAGCFMLVAVCVIFFAGLSRAEECTTEKFDSSLELEQEDNVYSQRATPDGPLYFFKRKGDEVYLIQEGKEILLTESGDSPRAPGCPFLWLDDADFDGVPEIFVRTGGGSIGDLYLVFDASGKDITRNLFRDPDKVLFIDGNFLVFPCLQPEKKTLTTAMWNGLSYDKDTFAIVNGKYERIESAWAINNGAICVTQVWANGVAGKTTARLGACDDPGNAASAFEVYCNLSLPLLKKPQDRRAHV